MHVCCVLVIINHLSMRELRLKDFFSAQDHSVSGKVVGVKHLGECLAHSRCLIHVSSPFRAEDRGSNLPVLKSQRHMPIVVPLAVGDGFDTQPCFLPSTSSARRPQG